MTALRFPTVVFFASALAVPACAVAEPEPSGESDEAVASAPSLAYSLPSPETALVADSAGKMALLSLGAASTMQTVTNAAKSPPVRMHAVEGVFYVLAANGKLTSVDATNATAKVVLDSKIAKPVDFALRGNDVYVASETKSLIAKFDKTTGKKLASLDLKPLAGARQSVSLQEMVLVGDRLFVQVRRRHGNSVDQGAVAVVHATTLEKEAVFELEASGVVGREPGGPPIYDAAHKRVFITARGARPSNTGAIFRIALEPTVHLEPWVMPAQSGFQGPMTLGPANSNKAYVAYHTSTPVASTHLFEFNVDADANPKLVGTSALTDAFEEVWSYANSSHGRYFAYAITCPAGFCLGGKGIAFVDGASATLPPRLATSTLGMEPTFVSLL